MRIIETEFSNEIASCEYNLWDEEETKEHALICVNEILPIAKNYMGFGDIFSKKELFKHYWEDVYQNIIQLKK